jgi:hypothetical protein
MTDTSTGDTLCHEPDQPDPYWRESFFMVGVTRADAV